ncbi:MAG TPA: HAD family phosphatase [Saprospiraceae bacterium]|nr:HAD family phosphatase [Saprospiraceae bacterium]
MKNNIRNLLFDLGNVIVDIDIDGAYARLRSLFRADAKEELIEKALLDYECGRISTDIFINSILRQSERRYQAIDVIEAWNSMLVGIPPYRLEMLEKLRSNYSVYLLSNTNALHLEWIHRYVRKVHHVESFEKQFFDQAFYSHLVGDRKPNPSIFKFITEDAFLTPALTLYMDDVQENLDVAGKLGFETYLVKPGEEIAEYLKEKGFF